MSTPRARPLQRALAWAGRPAGRLLSASFRDRPVFVVGPGRSGTTILLEAIGAHPAVVAAPGESPFARVVGGASAELDDGPGGYRRSSLRTTPAEADELMRRLIMETALGSSWGLRRVLGKAARQRRPPRLERWCAKTFPDAREARGLLRLYPEARFVYAVRDGAEVVRSRTRFAPMRERGFAEHCREWAEAVARYAYLRDHPCALVVRHEALVADPRGELARIVDFLGLAANPACGDYAARTLVHPSEEPVAGGDVRDHLTSRPSPHAGWTQEERSTFADLCGDAMRALGYDVDP